MTHWSGFSVKSVWLCMTRETKQPGLSAMHSFLFETHHPHKVELPSIATAHPTSSEQESGLSSIYYPDLPGGQAHDHGPFNLTEVVSFNIFQH